MFHFGNLPRNAIVGPGFSNTDLSVIKNVDAAGSARLQLRVEVFNLFNVGELRPAGPHRDGRQHVVRRDHEHALPDRRLRVGAPGAVRGEVPLLAHCVPVGDGLTAVLYVTNAT